MTEFACLFEKDIMWGPSILAVALAGPPKSGIELLILTHATLACIHEHALLHFDSCLSQLL